MEESINVCIFDERAMTWMYINEVDADGIIQIDRTDTLDDSIVVMNMDINKAIEVCEFLQKQINKYHQSKIASLENDVEVLTKELESTNKDFGI